MEARLNYAGNAMAMTLVKYIKDALAAGESQQRINLVAVWRESPLFTDAERAALELAEQGTRIADAAGGVHRSWPHRTDEVGVVAGLPPVRASVRCLP